jgi:putative ABC transport system permease protein
MTDAWRDVRQALRALRRNPMFAVVALATLTLGIGANTAIFTVVNGVLLRPMAYAHPDRLVSLDTGTPAIFPLAPAEYFELREINRTFAEVGAFTSKDVNLSFGDHPLRVRAVFADRHLLDALEFRPAAGRLFTTTEAEVTAPWYPGDEPPPADVAVLSHELWQTAFGGQPVIGTRVDVDGRRREIVGIMPAGADVKDLRAGIWLPLGLNPSVRGFRGYHILSVIARLKDGVTYQAAENELRALMSNWASRAGLPEDAHVFTLAGEYPHPLRMTPLRDAIVGNVSRQIWILQAAVGVILLIVCTNLANLLLARAHTRRREFAIRSALGAGTVRLLRQSMAEGAVLSLAAGILGTAGASLGVQTLVRAYPDALPRAGELTADVNVLLFSIGLAIATGLLFGIAPLGQMRLRIRLAGGIHEDARSSGLSTRHPLRRALVVAQVALAVVLVAGAALLARTLYNLAMVDTGFERAHLVTFSIAAPDTNVRVGRVQVYQRVLETLRATTGIEAATAMSGLPPAQHFDSEDTQIDNYEWQPGKPFEAVDYYQSVMTDYFETMGIPIVQGRGFAPGDVEAPGMVAVVNERLVNTFWKGRNPIGQRIKPDWGDWVPWFTVVGVARDIRQNGVTQAPGTELYFFVDEMSKAPAPLGRTPETINVVLRTTQPAAALAPAIQRAVHDADPTVPVARLREMDDVFAEAIRRPRLLAQLLGAFAGLALLLAAIGTYGLLSYMVGERRREIGVRMALGATRSRVVALVMSQGLRLVLVGIALGMAAAASLNRVMQSLLYGVEPGDPVTIMAVLATLIATAFIACGLPAWRAARVDPNVVLRTE